MPSVSWHEVVLRVVHRCCVVIVNVLLTTVGDLVTLAFVDEIVVARRVNLLRISRIVRHEKIAIVSPVDEVLILLFH